MIIEAHPGKQTLSDTEYEVGPVLLKNKTQELADYAAFRLRVARKALEGAQNGNDHETIDALKSEIAIWEDVERCL